MCNKNKGLFFNILEQSFLYLCDNYTEKSNVYFYWYLQKMKEGYPVFLECLMKIGEQSIFRISGVCSIFVLDVVKLISNEENKDVAVLCLSNMVVGVYMNNKSYDFSEVLNTISDEGI